MDCLLGNHEEMWKDGVDGMRDAFYQNNGGFWTVYGLLDAVINDLVDMPKQVFEQNDSFYHAQVKRALSEYKDAYKRFLSCFREENISELNPWTPDFLGKIAVYYPITVKKPEAGLRQFFYDIFAEMREYFQSRPLVRIIDKTYQTDEKFVLTHSGFVPTRNGQILTAHREMTKLESEAVVWYRPGEYYRLDNGVDVSTQRVAGHINLHGHTPVEEDENYIHRQNGILSAVNLDGGAAGLGAGMPKDESFVVRCLCLDIGKIYSINKNGKLMEKQIQGFC